MIKISATVELPGVEFAQGCTCCVNTNAISYVIDERSIVVQAAMHPVQVLQPFGGFCYEKMMLSVKARFHQVALNNNIYFHSSRMSSWTHCRGQHPHSYPWQSPLWSSWFLNLEGKVYCRIGCIRYSKDSIHHYDDWALEQAGFFFHFVFNRVEIEEEFWWGNAMPNSIYGLITF